MRPARYALAALILAACSAPRYTYDFGQPPSVAPVAGGAEPVRIIPAPESSALSAQIHVTSTSDQPAATERSEERALRHAPRPAEIQHRPALSQPEPAAPPLDADARRAAIFVVGGLIALLIGGQVFYVAGSLALLIGLIFGIKWVSRK